MTNALELIVSAIENSTGKPAKRSGDKVMCVCTHSDAKKHSLSVADGDDRVLLHCFSRNCDPKTILEDVGLDIKDIYHQQLSPKQNQQQKVFINDRQLKADLSYELIILMAWLSDCASGVFPMSNSDRERVVLALGRINKATAHYLNEGVI